TNQLDSLRTLVNDMNAGSVQTLLILGTNPVYDAPADLNFAGVLKKVPFTIHLGLYADETAQACQWHLPESHYLEAWGDARAYDGTVSIVQPLIAPLYDSRSDSEVLSMLGSAPQASHEIVKSFWQSHAGTNFDSVWQTALSTGVMPNTAF